jgi:HEAT repeat protein
LTGREKNLLRLVPAPPDTAALLGQGLVDLYKAVKGAAFYPEGHPYRTAPLQRACQALQRLVAKGELVLAVNRQGFVPGPEGSDGSAMVLQLARECFIRRIASITFMSDLSIEDLQAFVDLLSRDPHKTASFGAFATQLEQSGVRTVWINEKDMAAIWAKRGGGPEAGDGVGEGEGEPGAGGEPDAASLGQASAIPGTEELLPLMAVERSDTRYQELGRELVERFRGERRDDAVLPVLLELLRQHGDREKSVPQREYALFALERIADGAADLLLDALESRELPDKEGIHRVLAVMGGKGAYWIIQRICLAEGLFEKKSLATALVRLGPVAAPPLIPLLKDQRWFVVRNVVAILGELRLPDTVISLQKPLYHDDQQVRKETVRALMKIGGEPAENLLIALLDDPDEGIVRHAILSLGLMHSRQAVPFLLKLLEKRDLLLKTLQVKKELLVALGRIGDRRGTPLLLKMLGGRRWPLFGKRLELKVEVASALGSLGDEAALAALSVFCKGTGPLAEACREAVDAIERVSGETDG